MPDSTALRVRRAVAQRKVKGHVATFAILVAIACMPLGLIAANYVGFAGWLAVLVVWFASVAVAGWLRASGRRSLSTQIARGRREWEASTRGVRVEIPVLAEPAADEIGLDDDVAEDRLSAGRASL